MLKWSEFQIYLALFLECERISHNNKDLWTSDHEIGPSNNIISSYNGLCCTGGMFATRIRSVFYLRLHTPIKSRRCSLWSSSGPFALPFTRFFRTLQSWFLLGSGGGTEKKNVDTMVDHEMNRNDLFDTCDAHVCLFWRGSFRFYCDTCFTFPPSECPWTIGGKRNTRSRPIQNLNFHQEVSITVN